MALEVLLVEDSPGDARLTREAFRDAKVPVRLHVASDGVQALALLRNQGTYAHAPRPDLILLDLYLPQMDGRAVLGHIKQDESLKTIPIIILTVCDSEENIMKGYDINAQGYLSKPLRMAAFEQLVTSIDKSWLTEAQLPHPAEHRGQV